MFDAMFLKALTKELTLGAESGRIMKVHQPFAHELVLYIRKNRENKRLLISAHPSYARVQFTADIPENPSTPPMFCMLLRKYLEGAVIEKITQLPNERILKLEIRGKDDIGENRFCELYIEIMGRHSNIVLVDREKGTIVDTIKHISPAQNSYRTLLPGAAYRLPPQPEKQDPFQFDSSQFAKNELPSTKELVSQFAGFSPLLAQEIRLRAQESSLTQAFDQVITAVRLHSEEQPKALYFRKNEKEDFYFMPLESMTEILGSYDSLSELLDAFYLGKARRDRVHQVAKDLERLLTNEIQRNKTKIEKLKQTLIEADEADKYRHYGELLTANLHQVSRGMTTITVEDFYNDMKPVSIPLDTRKSASQNSQAYFAKYQKLRNAVAYVNEQLTLTAQEIEYLETIQSQLELGNSADVEEIRIELAEQGYLRYKNKAGKRKKPTNPTPEKYRSSTGLSILVGKNNKQNDYLTNKLAKNNELWFHVKDLPGSHVVIQSPDPDETAIEEAAMIAAYFSKARLSGSVPVDATLVKHVKKPNGAKPGYVIYTDQTTYFVTPDEEKVRSLRQ